METCSDQQPEIRQEIHGVYLVRVDDPRLPLPEAIRRLIRVMDGQLTFSESCQRANIAPSYAPAVLKKLCQLGLLEARSSRSAPSHAPSAKCAAARQQDSCAGRAGFSKKEIEFFETELQPIDACDEPFHTWRENLEQLFIGLRTHFAQMLKR